MKGKVYRQLFISNTCVVAAGLGPAGGDMSRQAAVQAVQAQHGDQQGAAAAARRREPLPRHLRPQDQGDGVPRAEVRQLQPAAAEGAAGRAQQLGGGLPGILSCAAYDKSAKLYHHGEGPY